MTRNKVKRSRTTQRKRQRLIPVLPGLVIGLAVAGILVVAGGFTYAANLENHDSFCASCHTEHESTYYQRTQAAAPVDLASAHAAKGVTCIQCHSGPGFAGRMDAMTGIAVGDLLAYWSGHYHNPSVVTVAIGDVDCLKCHADVAAKQSFDNHFHIFLAQWQKADPQNAGTCVECHQAHPVGGQAEIAFLREAPTVAVCQRCHAAAGRD